nr:hypothetical protein [Nitrospira sp.]
EKAYIIQVLRETDWVVEGDRGAAVRIDLHPNTLRSRMQKLGIRSPATQGKVFLPIATKLRSAMVYRSLYSLLYTVVEFRASHQISNNSMS